jgi:hypothetical protein
LTQKEKDELQRRVELIHANWDTTANYIAPPTIGELARFDNAALVTPPPGFEVGYVPIIRRQVAAIDSDSDGVADPVDAFPNDPSESVDLDGDGVGDNADAFPDNALYNLDSDSDGMPDSWETQYGLDPNDSSDATSDNNNDGVTALNEFLTGAVPKGFLDIDGNGQYNALTDGLLLLRSMFGLEGSALITGTVALDANYTDSVDIKSRIEGLGALADIDGNGSINALTDGLLTLRYLFGLRGDILINDVLAVDATRTTSDAIEAYLETLVTP